MFRRCSPSRSSSLRGPTRANTGLAPVSGWPQQPVPPPPCDLLESKGRRAPAEAEVCAAAADREHCGTAGKSSAFQRKAVFLEQGKQLQQPFLPVFTCDKRRQFARDLPQHAVRVVSRQLDVPCSERRGTVLGAARRCMALQGAARRCKAMGTQGKAVGTQGKAAETQGKAVETSVTSARLTVPPDQHGQN